MNPAKRTKSESVKLYKKLKKRYLEIPVLPRISGTVAVASSVVSLLLILFEAALGQASAASVVGSVLPPAAAWAAIPVTYRRLKVGSPLLKTYWLCAGVIFAVLFLLSLVAAPVVPKIIRPVPYHALGLSIIGVMTAAFCYFFMDDPVPKKRPGTPPAVPADGDGSKDGAE